jgi:hypothetical protein
MEHTSDDGYHPSGLCRRRLQAPDKFMLYSHDRFIRRNDNRIYSMHRKIETLKYIIRNLAAKRTIRRPSALLGYAGRDEKDQVSGAVFGCLVQIPRS